VRARQAVAAGVIAFLGLVPILWVVTETLRPHFLDPSYLDTRAAYRAALAEHPNHEVCVVIGSSRIQTGFAPERVAPRVDSAGRAVLWFNASHFEAGPLLNYATLRRLLREGPPPDLVVVELLPAFLVRSEVEVAVRHTGLKDAGACFGAAGFEWAAAAIKRRVWRVRDLWAELAGRDQYLLPIPGPLGGGPYLAPVTPEESAKRTAAQLAWFDDYQTIPFIHHTADAATRALIETCRNRNIRLAFVRTPESGTFRAACGPDGRSRYDAWVAGLVREYGVRVIDASDWLPDDQFVDGHHPTTTGADAFTARLVQEVDRVK
jgi:hypothetical protein